MSFHLKPETSNLILSTPKLTTPNGKVQVASIRYRMSVTKMYQGLCLLHIQTITDWTNLFENWPLGSKGRASSDVRLDK